MRTRQFVGLILTASIFLVALLSVLLPVSRPLAGQVALPEQIQEIQLEDTTQQRRAHRVLLLATVVAVAGVAVARRRNRIPARRSSPPRSPLSTRVVSLVALVVVILSFTRLSWYIVGLGATVTLLGLGTRRGAARERVETIVAWGLVVYLAVVMIPGLLQAPDLTLPSSVPPAMAEIHYSVIMSHGDRLAVGQRLFSDVMPQYGLIGPLAIAGIERLRGGLLTFATHIRFVQAMQMAFALAAFLCYWLWSGKRLLQTALVFLPMLTLVHTKHASVFCPNQSGWRFAGLPIGILALLTLGRGIDRVRVSLCLGAVLGVLLLFNPETGIVIGVAYLTFALADQAGSSRPFKNLIMRLLVASGAAAAVVLVFGCFYRVVLGYWPLPAHTSTGYSLARFAAGFGGLRLTFMIAWVVMLAHSIFEIVRATLSIESLTFRRKIRLAIAAAIAVWFGYFMNRPAGWNLWTLAFLYGFFIIDFAAPARLARYLKGLKRGGLALGLGILTMFVAAFAIQILTVARDGLRGVVGARPPGQLLSGVRVPPWYAELASRRGEAVRRLEGEKHLAYFTSNLYFVPILSGVFSPYGDAYELFSVDEFERLVERIDRDGPPLLLFDDPAAELVGSPERRSYYQRLKGRLSSYRFDHRSEGWEVWTRRQ